MLKSVDFSGLKLALLCRSAHTEVSQCIRCAYGGTSEVNDYNSLSLDSKFLVFAAKINSLFFCRIRYCLITLNGSQD
jgi:hypothetical protein